MTLFADLMLVFIAGLITALATGLGAIPFFFFTDISDRWVAALWGLAGGIMLSASTFGLIREGIAYGTYIEVGAGLLLGAILVELAERVIHEYEFKPREIADADFSKLVLILGVLTVHSFPEGVAIGVSFAELGAVQGIHLLGFVIPVLAVFMTVAISIQNIPEGLAVSIPLHSFNYSKKDMVYASVFSSLPQPIGAVLAFYFVILAKQFLPIGFGFAAGAMIYLVFDDMLPEGLERAEDSPTNGWLEVIAGLVIGFLSMIPLIFLI